MKKVILDHDLGTNPDDFFSLLMLLNSKGVDIELVVSGNNFPAERSLLAKRIIESHGTSNVRVVQGEVTGHIDFYAHELIVGMELDKSLEYKEEIKKILDGNDDVTYLCIEGTANISSFLKAYPQYIDTFKIVHMGMSLPTSEFITGGTNMEADQIGAKYLYELGLKEFRVIGAHTTINDSIRVTPDTELYKKIASSNVPNHGMLLKHLHDYNNRRGIWPALHDPLATSVVLGYDFVDFEEVSFTFNGKGEYRAAGKSKVSISKKEINDSESFMSLCTELI